MSYRNSSTLLFVKPKFDLMVALTEPIHRLYETAAQSRQAATEVFHSQKHSVLN